MYAYFTATALKYNTLLEDLYLGDNDLQSADGVSIGTMLSANKTLQLLDLRNNSFRVSVICLLIKSYLIHSSFRFMQSNNLLLL